MDPDKIGTLYRLMTWLSPSFPVGAYSYSHGLEYAVEAGLVCDRITLEEWGESVIQEGSGRVDAILFCAAYRAFRETDGPSGPRKDGRGGGNSGGYARQCGADGGKPGSRPGVP